MKEQFKNKVIKEHDDYKKAVLDLNKDEVYDRAFEIVVKNYIKDYLLENEEFTDEQLEKMNGIDNLIEYIFEYFLENGEYLEFDDLCEECINDVLESLGIIQSEIE